MAVKGLWNLFGVNIPDTGWTERRTTWQSNPAAVRAYGAPQSVPSGSTGMQSTPGGTQYTLGKNTVTIPNKVLGASTVNNSVNNNQQNNAGNQGGGGGGQSNGGGSVDNSAADMERAAREAAEARRQAAMRGYETKKAEAGMAKQEAKGTYDWIIETLGSNKKDLLDTVNLEESQGIERYGKQREQTQGDYGEAKKNILNTYRDLKVEQEKILRGAGVGQSSRSIEAEMRLNNLMGKDLTTVTTNEADALAMIGTAVQALSDKAGLTRTSIEREAKSKADQAGLEYQKQINTIDNNLNLSANEREDQYAAAEAQLASDIAGINTWKAQARLTAEQSIAKTKDVLDDFIVDMTNESGKLNSDLNTKRASLNDFLTSVGSTQLTTESGLAQVNQGQYRKPTSKSELDQMLAAGQIDQSQYQSQLATIQMGSGGVNMTQQNPLEDRLSQVAFG